jgi:hypothetical protein
MARIILAISFLACQALGQELNGASVSSAFGNKINLYERDIGGVLVFALANDMPSAVEHYEIEVLGVYEHTPTHRVCSIDVNKASIPSQSKALLANTCALDTSLGKPLSHASRIVAVRLANGWEWHRRAPVISQKSQP